MQAKPNKSQGEGTSSKLLVLPIMLWGLGMLVLLMACDGQASRIETKANATPTPFVIEIIVPDPTTLAAIRTAQPDRGATMSASNASPLTALAQTPLPTPLSTPPANGTGIIPGKTDEAGVRALLGTPSHISEQNGIVSWSFQTARIPQVGYVTFEQGVVTRIEIDPDQPQTAASIVAQYGPPTVIGFIESRMPEESPSTIINQGYMFYPSQGIRFFFDCYNTPDGLCHGISKYTRTTYVTYFVPTSVEDWLRSEKPERQYVLAPWSGFSESNQ